MSLFIGNSSQYSNVLVNPEKIRLAEVQFSSTAATFNRIISTCAKKCINHEYGEGELATGEGSCVDRCVSKYFQANIAVGTEFQQRGVDPMAMMPEYRIVEKRKKRED